MSREILQGRLYRHFKGMLYYVHNIATHTETGEQMVVYQALYGDYKMYTRPLEMFAEETPEGRSDNVTGQKHRFEEMDRDEA